MNVTERSGRDPAAAMHALAHAVAGSSIAGVRGPLRIIHLVPGISAIALLTFGAHGQDL